MLDRSQLYRWSFVLICVFGTLLSLFKTVRAFLLNPHEMGVPRGAAEDWLLLSVVLVSATASAWKAPDIAAIGRITIAVFGIGIALIFFQDVVETSAGFIPPYIQNGQKVVERSGVESALMGAIFLAIGAGVYQWRAWAHKLCLVVSFMLGLGCIGYLAFEGFDWKPVVALAVVISVIVWLHLPVVRYRLRVGPSQ